jgi:transcriptional regulator with XRE-family HTH domain
MTDSHIQPIADREQVTEPNSLDFAKHLAQRVAALRARQGLSLQELALLSGVSRSMISQIERCETNPTALVLDRLASALGVTLTQLLEPAGNASPLSKRLQQLVWKDPETGYERRSVSPPGHPSRLRLIEVIFPAGARIAYEPNAAPVPIDQQVWLLQGQMQITVNGQMHALQTGDCLAMTIDQPIVFFNPSNKAARYVVGQA